MTHPLVLELHVPDFGEARKFYRALGFAELWTREADEDKGYVVTRNKEGATICFWPGTDSWTTNKYFGSWPPQTRRGFGVEVVLQVEDLDAVYEAALGLGAVVEELCEQPWGLRDFRVADPFGYYLRFTEVHDISDVSFAVD